MAAETYDVCEIYCNYYMIYVFSQEEHKAKSVQVPQVPGIDFKVKVLFTKVSHVTNYEIRMSFGKSLNRHFTFDLTNDAV